MDSLLHDIYYSSGRNDCKKWVIIGGVIWGRGTQFVKSHGVKTPDAKRKKLDDYLVTIAEIEELTGEVIPVRTM